MNWQTTPEFEIVRRFYYGLSAKRTGLPYIRHIEQGCQILVQMRASEHAIRGFCLHPIVQDDNDLLSFRFETRTAETMIRPFSWMLAMEYRKLANSYLSKHYAAGDERWRYVELSPLEDVNNMLIADKVQNRHDYELFIRGKFDSKADNNYYKWWLRKLNVSEMKYRDLTKHLKTSS